MGRCLAIALLGFGMLSLSCNRTTLAVRPATDGAEHAAASDVADPADMQQLGGLEQRFETLARKLAPSVVAISASSQVFDSDDALRSDSLNPDRLENLLDRSTRMVGTGLILDADGYILTNEHVVGEAENVWVTTDDGKVYPALVVGSDPRSDLAILKIPASGLTPVTFAPDAPLRRGQWAIALGNPYGLATSGSQAMAVGVISALDRSLPKLSRKENRLYSGLIQTTTPINPGNSGGPLFDINGRVIGINTAVILPEKKTNGIGFAMPISPSLLDTVRSLKEGREICYAYLGVSVTTLTLRERRTAGLDDNLGVRIDSVDKNSPAEPILKEGDLLVKIGDQAICDSEQFVRIVGRAPFDRPCDLQLLRDGKTRTLPVSLRMRHPTASAVTRESRRMRWEGLVLGPIPRNWPVKGAARPEKGLVVLAISDKSCFAKDGVKQGDVITSIAGQPLADVTDLQKLINDLPPNQRSITLAGHKSAVASVKD